MYKRQRVACAGEVDGEVVDLRTVIDKDCELNILTFDSDEGKHAFRHTASHILAQAVKRLYPETKLAIGPSIDNGCYYDMEKDTPFTQEDLEKIEKEMKKIIIIITCFIGLSGAFAQQREIFHNPVIEADVPDPSMIRVGNYYYLVSTTMHLMPGCPVMRSKDLVHWETISYVFQRLTDLPRYDLKEGTVYGRGQWASSIRYHDGRFYVWFSPNDEPHRGYIYTAEDPAGEWTLVSRPPHHHDASLFFDDDGKVYLFYGTGQLRQLKSDLSDVEPGGIDQKIFERDADEQGLLEGSQAFKHNGRYYVMMISMDWSIPGRLRREVCYRADQITGPYEKKVILETEFQGYGGVGQGCIVDTPDGNWYGFIFQDRGGIGRVPTLMPCRWEDGWPILGDADGRVPECMEMPASGEKCKGSIMGSDDFDTDRLSLNLSLIHI